MGLNDSLGKRIADPWVAVAMYPKMQPKQWKSGGGQQTMSDGVRPMREPMKYPLLRMEWWVRQAALGRDVVPDVNWMLTISSLSKALSGFTALVSFEEKSSKKGVVAEKDEVSIREEELSTRIIFRSEGIDADSSFFAERSGAICFRSVIFSLGGL